MHKFFYDLVCLQNLCQCVSILWPIYTVGLTMIARSDNDCETNSEERGTQNYRSPYGEETRTKCWKAKKKTRLKYPYVSAFETSLIIVQRRHHRKRGINVCCVNIRYAYFRNYRMDCSLLGCNDCGWARRDLCWIHLKCFSINKEIEFTWV